MCLTGKDHFIEFCKHSGMVNTKFMNEILLLTVHFITLYKLNLSQWDVKNKGYS